MAKGKNLKLSRNLNLILMKCFLDYDYFTYDRGEEEHMEITITIGKTCVIVISIIALLGSHSTPARCLVTRVAI